MNYQEDNPFQMGRGLMPGQYAVVLVKDAWKKLADYLESLEVPEDIKTIHAHILIQTGLVDEVELAKPKKDLRCPECGGACRRFNGTFCVICNHEIEG